MKNIANILITLALLAGTANAKWWIFGKSADDVEIKYLTINSVSADESGKKITLFKETLQDGTVKIKGKAKAGKNQIGSVRISLDDKATWQEVKAAENGAFEFFFTPEQGKKYVFLLEATDTTGKVNKVDETRKEIEVSAENIRGKITEVLDAMFEAYNKEDAVRFISYVSENFAGDKAFLELAAKKDFNALNNINMRYTISNIASGSGKIFASITFNRMVFVNKTGRSSTDGGTTEFVFEMNGGKPLLYSMKQPLVFGLSDADNVATGEVIGNTASNLELDETGDLNYGTSVTFSNPDRSSYTRTYIFLDGSLESENGFATVLIGDIGVDIMHIWIKSGVESKVISGKSLSQVTLADLTSGTWNSTNPAATDVSVGKVYGFKVGSSYYAIEIESNNMGDPSFIIKIRVKSF